MNSSIKRTQYQQKNDTFPCGSLSPCLCTKSAQDPGLTIVSQCPVENFFLMIAGIEANRVKITPAIISKFDGFKMNISIMNNTMKSIVDLHIKDAHWQVDQALGDIITLLFKNNTRLVLPDFDRFKTAGAENLIFLQKRCQSDNWICN